MFSPELLEKMRNGNFLLDVSKFGEIAPCDPDIIGIRTFEFESEIRLAALVDPFHANEEIPLYRVSDRYVFVFVRCSHCHSRDHRINQRGRCYHCGVKLVEFEPSSNAK